MLQFNTTSTSSKEAPSSADMDSPIMSSQSQGEGSAVNAGQNHLLLVESSSSAPLLRNCRGYVEHSYSGTCPHVRPLKCHRRGTGYDSDDSCAFTPLAVRRIIPSDADGDDDLAHYCTKGSDSGFPMTPPTSQRAASELMACPGAPMKHTRCRSKVVEIRGKVKRRLEF